MAAAPLRATGLAPALLQLLLLAPVLAASASAHTHGAGSVAAAAQGVRVRVTDGRVVGGPHAGEWVGVHTSELAANVVWNARFFANVTSHDWAATSRINGTILRHLVLDGAYLADVPLRLPSLFVLQLVTTCDPYRPFVVQWGISRLCARDRR